MNTIIQPMETPLINIAHYKEIEGLLLIAFVSQGSGASMIALGCMNDLTAKYGNYLRSWELDVDQYPQFLEEFRVSPVPTLLILRQGQVLECFSGLFPRTKLEAAICKHLQTDLEPKALADQCASI